MTTAVADAPPPGNTLAPCGCPEGPGRRITDPTRHAAWHAEVLAQTGLAAGPVDADALHAARGTTGHVGRETILDRRDVASGKRASGARRRAAHGLDPLVPTGEHLAAAGKARALTAPDADAWRERAWQALRALAEQRRPFTSEDVTAAAGLPTGTVGTNANNAVGALLSAAARRGLILATGYAPSTRPGSHGATLRVWTGA